MHLSESWLLEHFTLDIDTHILAKRLTMAGLEVERVESVSPPFSNVVIGEVVAEKTHPNSDHLHLCQVNIGKPELLDIVCGANNVKAGIRVAVALVGATLPGGLEIKKAKLRGEESNGMICSAKELALPDIGLGILELPSDAEIGLDFANYLKFHDNIFEINITPNRGDCLSVLGVRREIAALYNLPYPAAKITQISAVIKDQININLNASYACPRYVGRVIREVNPNAQTPLWMQQKLQKVGYKVISALVDVTNYVMLELGNPLHAFDLDKIEGEINVRYATPGEELTLLSQDCLKLEGKDLVIADNNKPLALAGIMGGQDSAISDSTSNVFLESACFIPKIIAATSQKYNISSEASYRFIRGVDPQLPLRAIERATELILLIAGGKPGPITETFDRDHLPKTQAITLRRNRIKEILGLEIDDREVVSILSSLGMKVDNGNNGWVVRPPSYRFDVALEVDLLEELARIKGYEHIPVSYPQAKLTMVSESETKLSAKALREFFVLRGYHEVINYSFVDDNWQKAVFPEAKSVKLRNPISADLSVMRFSLWPALLKNVLYNQHRQQNRIRLFEMGTCFSLQQDELFQKELLAGIIVGDNYPKQWGLHNLTADFFTLKNDISALFRWFGIDEQEITWRKGSQQVLHPGRSVDIYRGEKLIGSLGELNPKLSQQFSLRDNLYLFELDLTYVYNGRLPCFNEISKFPAVMRDVAFTIAEKINAGDLLCAIKDIGGELLTKIIVFDVYRGEGIPPNMKSVALALKFQNYSRTLLETEVDVVMNNIVAKISNQFNCTLRS